MEREHPICSIYQAPGSNAFETADEIYKEMDHLKRSFPKDVDYVVPFESVSVVKVSIDEVVKTLLIALRIGNSCSIFLSAKLEVNIDPGSGDSGFYHRYICPFFAFWFYHQYIDDVWFCTRYWYCSG